MRADEVAISQVIDRVNGIERFPSGRSKDLGGGLGYVAAGQVFDAQTTEPDDDANTDHVAETFHDFALTRPQSRCCSPSARQCWWSSRCQRTRPWAGLWTRDELRDAISGDPYAYDGVSIEIDSDSENPLIVSTVTYRRVVGGRPGRRLRIQQAGFPGGG